MNRSLDELSASELNAAIDDTNFPKVQNFIVHSNNSPTLLSSSTDDASSVAVKNGTTTSADNNNDQCTSAGQSSHSNGVIGDGSIIKRIHPAPLKMVSFKEESFDVPGTPRTPRTSTTPGNVHHPIINFFTFFFLLPSFPSHSTIFVYSILFYYHQPINCDAIHLWLPSTNNKQCAIHTSTHAHTHK